MNTTKEAPLRQHPHGHDTGSIQRRYSFSNASLEVIEQGKRGPSGADKSPRKAFSLASMTENKHLLGHEEKVKPRQKKKKLIDSTTIDDQAAVQPNAKPDRDMSLLIDIKGHGGRFSDDDSDGESAYSPACSDGENSPTPSAASVASSSCNSISPLLRYPPDTGFEVLHSEASEPSPLEGVRQEKALEKKSPVEEDRSQEMKPRLHLDTTREKELAGATESPSHQQQQVKEEAKDAGEYDDDLPDWLHERIVLSPPTSMPKMSMRSPQQIEDEIRFAVDSAAARVQQEIDRCEQFQNALHAAAAYTPTLPTSDDQFTALKLAPGGSNDSTRLLNDFGDVSDMMHNEKQVVSQSNYDPAANDFEERDLLLVMEVVIGDGRAETIEVREGDNPTALAAAFAQKYALKPDAVPKLVSLIQEQLSAIAETEPEEITQGDLADSSDWMNGTALDDFVQSTLASVADAVITEDDNSANPSLIPHTEEIGPSQQAYVRDNHREYNYNNLVAKYGHYTQHSGKVDPDGRGARQSVASDTFVVGDMQFEQYSRVTGASERLPASTAAPAFTTMVSATRNNSLKKKDNATSAPAYERLYALAESKQKWIQRAQKAKEIEQARDQERMHNVEIMAAKSRELIAHRTNGGYAHIGDRFHGEALSDLAKKAQRHERRVAEREHQQDWMCPKCAFANRYSDNQCQNAVARVGQPLQSRRQGKSQTTHLKVLCGQPKPDRLFQPTLLTTSANVMKAVCANKEKTARVADLRRQRHQLALEEEFQQTCPFRPKINNVSEEIIREKLETAAASAAIHGETRLQRNPHLELYENSFHARAQREEQEQAYLKQFSFKPDIGVNALWVASDKSQNDFVERLAVDKYRELERKRAALYDKYAPNRDPHTGKELFKPEIGRAPAFARNKQGLPIGDFLYAAHQEQQEYHRQLRDKDQREIKQKAQQNFVSEASRQALEKRKADTCSRIFKALLELSRQPSSSSSIPSATNGSISLEQMPKESQPHKIEHSTQEKETNEVETVIPSQVDLTALPAEISRVVAIVFEFANHMPISRNAFLNYMDHLVGEIPGLTYTQILFLAEHLHDGKGSRHRHQQHHLDLEREAALAAAEQQELTFHPVINNNSREIATKHGRVASSKVFQALNQYFDHYQERKEQLRKQQQREFKKAHPFHPTFVTKAHQREPVATAFYDKIHLGNSKDTGNIVSWEVAASESSAPTLYGQLGAPLAPPAPLQTALSNARPSVRPIESEHTRFYTAADQEEAQFEDVSGEMSRSSSSSQLLEDADLTSRVLAALDEKPTKVKPTLSSLSSPSCSYHFFSPEKADSAKDDDNCMGKHGVVRSPEGATPDPMNFDDITDT